MWLCSYCVDPDGNDVQVLAEGASMAESSEEHGQPGSSDQVESSGSSASADEENCHFHAGVE